MRVLIVGTTLRSFDKFRYELIKLFDENGHEISLCGQGEIQDLSEDLRKITRHVMYNKSSGFFFSSFLLFLHIGRLIFKNSPDIIICYTPKAIILTGIWAKIFRTPRYYALFSGLGRIFSYPREHKPILVQNIFLKLYRFISPRFRGFIFQNRKDYEYLCSQSVLDVSTPVCFVGGSGVDIDKFEFKPRPRNGKFLMASRLLRSKGLLEYCQASQRVAENFGSSKFLVCGPEQGGAGGIKQELIALFPCVEYLGNVQDMASLLQEVDFLVLPSYYGEGRPRAILEALACGTPIITTDTPGCGDSIVPEVHGFISKARCDISLANSMYQALSISDERYSSMQLECRELACRNYDVRNINRKIFDFIIS